MARARYARRNELLVLPVLSTLTKSEVRSAMVTPISLRPKTESATTFASAGASPGTKIPRDLLEDAARRLGFLCLFLLAVSLFTVIVNELFIQSALAGARATRYSLLGVAWAATLGTYALTRWSKLPPTRLLDIGLGYEVFVAALIGLMVNRLPWPDAVTLPGWSPGRRTRNRPAQFSSPML